MSKSIKHQLIHAIKSNFKEGQDKHAMKRGGYERQSTIFSYSDRKNLMDTAAGFSNWLKGQPDPPRRLYDIKPQHVQAYLNAHAKAWTAATFKTRLSHLRKLETLAARTYPNSKIAFTEGVVLPATATSPKRTVQVSEADYGRLLSFSAQSKSQARHAVFLSGSCGLRVSECAKLKGSDITVQPDGSATVRVVDSKGKRSRTITLNNPDTASRLAEIRREVGEGRVCPVQSESLNAYLRRAFAELGMTEYTKRKTGFHALRKLAAQRHYNDCRDRGLSVKEALSETSVFLGHGRNRDELMKHYVLEIK